MKVKTSSWIVWVIVSIFYAYQYILRVMPNIMLNDITNQFHINEATFGQFAGVYYIGYSLIHIPIGIFLDKFGPKKVIPICIFLMIIGLCPLLFASNWAYPLLGRLLIGIGSSAAILGVFKVVRITFHETKFPRMLSISVTIGLLGAIYGSGPVASLCQMFGYQKVIQIFILIGLILAFLIFVLIPETERTYGNTSSIFCVKKVISNSNVLKVCLFSGLMLGTLEGFADAWGTTFLQTVYLFDKTTASYLPSLIFIGMCLCAPALSIIGEKIGYIRTIYLSGILMSTIFIALIFLNLNLITLYVLFFILGACSSYQIIAIYQASTYVQESIASITTAFTNMIIMLFGYFLHSIIGIFVTLFGGSNDIFAMKIGVLVIPITTIIGALGFLFLKESKKV